jgi:hypothetical protein
MTSTAHVAGERPILFSGEMVRAILDGRKTQTRRVVRNQSRALGIGMEVPEFRADIITRCPYGQPGDRLWVRETWCSSPDGVMYRATEHEHGMHQPDDCNIWRPSIHMPRWASRLTLSISDVRVERLQDMRAPDAIAEGIPSRGIDREGPNIASALMYLHDYKQLWDSLNAKRGYGWATNPWVWVISFTPDKAPLP